MLIFSDLHTFLSPLRAMDAVRAGYGGREQVIFNGDNYHGGLQPIETTQWIMDHAGPLATLGNHDEAMLATKGEGGVSPPPCTEPGAYQVLSAEQREYVAGLPHRLALEWRGVKIVVMHGHVTPGGGEGSYRWSPSEQIEHFVDGSADLYVLGHTHYAYVEEVDGGIAANSGSAAVPILAFADDEGVHPQSGRETIEGEDLRCSFMSVTEDGGKPAVEIVRFDYDRDAMVAEFAWAGEEHLTTFRRWLAEGVLG